MGCASNEQVRELTAEELELVTGGFLGKLIRKVGRAAGTAVGSPLGFADSSDEGAAPDFGDD